jgi:hypothetical protein
MTPYPLGTKGVNKMGICLNCEHCFACVCIADDGKELTDKKIKTICKVMGGYKPKRGGK